MIYTCEFYSLGHNLPLSLVNFRNVPGLAGGSPLKQVLVCFQRVPVNFPSTFVLWDAISLQVRLVFSCLVHDSVGYVQCWMVLDAKPGWQAAQCCAPLTSTLLSPSRSVYFYFCCCWLGHLLGNVTQTHHVPITASLAGSEIPKLSRWSLFRPLLPFGSLTFKWRLSIRNCMLMNNILSRSLQHFALMWLL